MRLDIIIPYEPKKELGRAYNRAVKYSTAQWILFVDYDVLILNHKFYDICVSAIEKAGPAAGWITARTNRLGPLTKIHQLDSHAPQSDDIQLHSEYARQLYATHGDSVVDITNESKQVPLSGFFILTPKRVAETVLFRDGFLGVDNWYCQDLLAQNYTTWLIPGLYCYHRYTRDWRNDK